MTTPGFSASATSDDPDTADTAVEMRTAATARHLSSIRAVAADLAMRLDYDLDSVADLRLAVDEACSTLVQLAMPDSWLHCRFTADDDELRVLVSVRSTDGAGPSTATFSWQVLHTLAEQASSEVRRDGERFMVSIELIKRKPTAR